MPELPEVETVRQTLRPLVINHKICDVKIFMNKIIKEMNSEHFVKTIIGQTIKDVQRIGKLLIFILDDYVLLSHLRMEGKYYYQKKALPLNNKHILLAISFDNDYILYYHDTRRFGTFHLQDKANYHLLKPYINIGPEPFNSKVTASYLQQHWQKKKQNIKTTLLAQNIISGLGNIYVNEVLFAAKIHPESITNNLLAPQLAAIVTSAQRILQQAINMGGTTISSYTSSLGVTGYYQKKLQVHMRDNLPCYKCKKNITKIKLNGRGTYFCPQCQIKY